MKTKKGNKRKSCLALLLAALMVILPLAGNLPQLTLTVDAEETDTVSDSTDDTNLVDSLAAYYSFDGTLENSVTGDSATVYSGADTWNENSDGTATYNSTNMVSESAYVFSGNQSAASETISGRTWWKDVEYGQNYELSGDGIISFTVKCTSDVSDYAAFSTELYDASGNYLTTGSDGNAWFAGNASGDVSADLTSSVIAAGTTYLVTVTREGTDFTVIYYDQTDGSVFAILTATASAAFDDTLYVHFIAQAGTFDITRTNTYVDASETTVYMEEEDAVTCDDVEIDTGFSAHTGEVTLSGDFILTYTFMNTSTGSSNWENFILEMYTPVTSTDDDGNVIETKVYLDVRADNYGWLAYNSDSDTLVFGDGASDWNIWNAAMAAGSECTVVVKRIGTSIVVTATCGGETFTATADVSEYDDADLTIYLTGEKCKLTDVSYTVATWVYDNIEITDTDRFSAHTGEVTLTGDFELTYTFHNISYNDDANYYYYNYALEIVSGGVYVDVRADNYGWLYGNAGGDTLEFGDGLNDWTSWNEEMVAGCDCTVTVVRTGTSIVITSVSGGETFTATAYVSEYDDDAEITLYLTGEQCEISDVSSTVSQVLIGTLSDEFDTTSTSGNGLLLDVTTSDSFTVSGWVYTKQKTNYQPVVFVFNSTDDYINVGTIFNDCWTAALAMIDGWNGTVLWVDNSSKDIEIGEWTYVTLTVTAYGTVTYYLNGEEVDSESFGDVYNSEFSNVPIYLGVNCWNDSFCGLMDELTVYSAALTADEVATLYALDGDPDAAAEAEENGETWSAINRVSVHDPSIVKGYVDSSVASVSSSTTVVPEATDSYTKEIYFVFGSHLAWAYSWDLINWYTFTNNLNTDYETVFAEEFEWAATGDSVYEASGNMWAPDVIWVSDYDNGDGTNGAWCMYMSINGCSWNSSICMLTSTTLFGDWELQGDVVFSGFDNNNYTGIGRDDYLSVTGDNSVASRYLSSGSYSFSDGDSKNDPSYWNIYYGAHAIDPCVIYDANGDLWMSYGSWSGGIYLLRLDSSTGLRDTDTTYTDTSTSDPYMGYLLAGTCHSSGEASYIKYVESTGYYYIYISYGGFTTTGGYNMRLFRSKDITGQSEGYVDVTGDSAIYSANTDNTNGSVGLRMISYYKYSFQDYASTAQGHNSMLIDDDGNMYVVYHTKSNDGTEGHQLRVRQLFVTGDGWLASAPFEYTGDADTGEMEAYQIAGTYEVIFHDSTEYASLAYNSGDSLTFALDGTVSGTKGGTTITSGSWAWSGTDGYGSPYVDVTLNGTLYQGIFLKQSKEENSSIYSSSQVVAFTLVTSSDNSSSSDIQELSVWGYMTEAATATVTVTSISTTSSDSVADLTGGDTYTLGDSVTVTAPSVSGYSFVGWYTATTDEDGSTTYDSSGDALSTEQEYTFKVTEDVSLVAVYEADASSTMTLTVGSGYLNGATYTVTVEDTVAAEDKTVDFTEDYAVGTKVSLTANTSDSATFAYWMNGSLKIVSTDATYEFTIVAETTVYPVYNTANSTNNSAIVDYVTYYGQVLTRKTYTASDTIEEPDTVPTRTGYSFSSWSMTKDQIKSAISAGSDTYIKVTPEYTKNESSTYTVSVYVDDEAQATTYSGTAGDTLTVTVESVSGKTFWYWADAASGGTILSYKDSYMVYLSQNIDLYAVYGDSEITQDSTIVMTNTYDVKETSSSSDTIVYKIAFEATRSVLDGCTVEETGMLFSTDSNYYDVDKLVVGANTSYVIRYISSSTEADGVFTLYADVTDSSANNGYSSDTVYARGYMVISDSSGNLYTYYTDIVAGTYGSQSETAE